MVVEEEEEEEEEGGRDVSDLPHCSVCMSLLGVAKHGTG